jgi:hypothetical protein
MNKINDEMLGIGDWGLGIGDWGLANPQSPIPNPQFIWEQKDKNSNENENLLSWEEAFAKRYYDKLYKEYCIADLTYHREGKYKIF